MPPTGRASPLIHSLPNTPVCPASTPPAREARTTPAAAQTDANPQGGGRGPAPGGNEGESLGESGEFTGAIVLSISIGYGIVYTRNPIHLAAPIVASSPSPATGGRAEMNKKTIRDVDLKGKRVLMRVDFNVPLNDALEITDDTRVQAALPSIKTILDQGASLVLMSHLGRPKGKVVAEMGLKPVADYLNTLIDADVKMAPATVGPEVDAMVAALQPGQILVLENTRFQHTEEGKKCEKEEQITFAKQLAAYGDVYVNDAFGTAHRAHASTEAITHLLPSAAGRLMQAELDALSKALESPQRPVAALVGGAKISSKMTVLGHLINQVDPHTSFNPTDDSGSFIIRKVMPCLRSYQ